MKSLQLPILAMIVIIVACAIAFTALKTASDLWYGAFYTFTTVSLVAAVIAARLFPKVARRLQRSGSTTT
jgi:membrane protein implicated in regulation of membrane protease activity